MIRNLKTLGLAFFAVFAMSAVVASAASATPKFFSEQEDTTLTGSQGMAIANVFTTDMGELKCKSVKFDGTMGPVETTTLTLKPTYQECQLAGENALVTVNGCRYVFHLGENTETLAAKMSIECPDGETLVVEVPECAITIPPQAGLGEAKFTNEGEETTRAVIADLNIGGIHYVEHGAGCENETVTTNNGTYTGQITIKGEAEEEHVGIWVE
jgi:hypothetical protein